MLLIGYTVDRLHTTCCNRVYSTCRDLAQQVHDVISDMRKHLNAPSIRNAPHSGAAPTQERPRHSCRAASTSSLEPQVRRLLAALPT